MTERIYLGVNIDHVATIRNARGTDYPDPVYAAGIVEHSGGDSITVHLREDRRHIKDRDVRILRETIKTKMNLEMAVTDELVGIACEVRPDFVCLVPERRQEVTTEGGLDVASQKEKVAAAVKAMSEAGIRVSLFIDPDRRQIDAAQEVNAPFIELHTGRYADAVNDTVQAEELKRLTDCAAYAASLGLGVNGGHGLSYENAAAVAAIPEIHELNIGHSIISRSVFTGLPEAVREMKNIITAARFGTQR